VCGPTSSVPQFLSLIFCPEWGLRRRVHPGRFPGCPPGGSSKGVPAMVSPRVGPNVGLHRAVSKGMVPQDGLPGGVPHWGLLSGDNHCWSQRCCPLGGPPGCSPWFFPLGVKQEAPSLSLRVVNPGRGPQGGSRCKLSYGVPDGRSTFWGPSSGVPLMCCSDCGHPRVVSKLGSHDGLPPILVPQGGYPKWGPPFAVLHAGASNWAPMEVPQASSPKWGPPRWAPMSGPQYSHPAVPTGGIPQGGPPVGVLHLGVPLGGSHSKFTPGGPPRGSTTECPPGRSFRMVHQ
jgi:hypothetical protein